MSVFTFTPLRFAVLLAVSVAASLWASNLPNASRPSTQNSLASPFRVSEAIGQDNGSLTSNPYLPADYPAMPTTRETDRRGIVSMPQGPPRSMHHFYPPLAR